VSWSAAMLIYQLSEIRNVFAVSKNKVVVFKVSGLMRGVLSWQPFTKYIVAQNQSVAKEKTLSIIGSKHRLRRHQIKVENVSVVNSAEDVDDPLVKMYFIDNR
jgi:large subunit ribosomal protein LX